MNEKRKHLCWKGFNVLLSRSEIDAVTCGDVESGSGADPRVSGLYRMSDERRRREVL